MDIGFIIASGCALSLICVGLIALLAFAVLRFTGQTLGGLLGGYTEDENLGIGNVQSASTAPRRSLSRGLRDRAPDLDFDAAIQRHQGSGPVPRGQRNTDASTDYTAQDERQVPPGFEEPRRRGDLRSQRTRRRDDKTEIYDDADGDLFDLF